MSSTTSVTTTPKTRLDVTNLIIVRLLEIVQVHGATMKERIHEEFGDGIMSAIDFTMSIDRVADAKGDRVKVVMEGKFLPYKVW